MQRQQKGEGGGGGALDGIEVAPGVRFSDTLWSRLGDRTREMEKQKRRDRITTGNTSAVPEIPTAIFDHVFRNDSTWKQR